MLAEKARAAHDGESDNNAITNPKGCNLATRFLDNPHELMPRTMSSFCGKSRYRYAGQNGKSRSP